MKRIVKILSLALMFFAFSGELYAQGVSTQGKEFWLSFGSNGFIYNLDFQVKIVTGGKPPDFDTFKKLISQIFYYQYFTNFATPFWVSRTKKCVLLRYVRTQKEEQVR